VLAAVPGFGPDTLRDGLRKVDETSFEISDEAVEEMMAGLPPRGARIVPSLKNGKPNGFKLYAIRPSSVYAQLGLENGDTIQAVNGKRLTTPDKALEIYAQVRRARKIELSIVRRAKPIVLTYRRVP
jgi:general secretion pathway protein C